MKKHAFHLAFALGLLALLWVAAAVARTHLLVLVMTAAIALVYLLGLLELQRFRRTTAQLKQALDAVPAELSDLHGWLQQVPAALREAVRLRVEGERSALPGPAFTPYYVGLLVMLGMLGTFLGMVVTLNGAVFALEGSSSVQGMRAAFSEPVRGLGLAFGTSVAGVATSAMLGLMASLSRRERALAALQLDGLIGQQLRPFSLAHQRQETLRALQQQSQALPVVAEQLQALMAQMARHSQQLSEQLSAQLSRQQDTFHREVQGSYTELARSVDETLRQTLGQSLQMASDSIRPVVQTTLAEMAEQGRTQHERMVESTTRQLQSLLQETQHSLQAHEQQLQARGEAWLAQLRSAQDAQTAAQHAQDTERQRAWQDSLQQLGQTLQQQWQNATQAQLAQQAQVAERLQSTTAAIDAQAQQMGQALHAELGALRTQEAERAQAAVQALGDLQAAVTTHLASLGTALEAPITRLIDTASQAPQAAAEVIAQLRQEMSQSMARDNALLEERTRILDTLNTLLASIQHASGEQRGVIDALVASSQQTLAQTTEQFQQRLAQDSGQLAEVAAELKASAVDVASLGEAMGFAVRSFSASNTQLLAQLQRIEAALGQSLARSDEQLAYYVAQARELIDLSVGSQKEVLDALLRTSTPEALVHAAGLLRVGALGALDAQDGQAMWALHVAAATRLANRVLPLMRRARAGRVILIGSRVAGGMPGRSLYAASKAALLALAKSWAGECIADGVTVNVVSPAATDTPMLRDPSRAGTPPQVPPIGRLIQPDEVAALVTYLTGPHAQAITGQDWVICGGASVRTP